MPVLGVRVWRTNDGRYVPDGHIDAVVLAYGTGDDVPDEAIPNEPRPERAPAEKAQPAAPNKARKQAANK